MGEFDKAVRIRLIELGRNQNWLMDEVKKNTGLYMDSSYLSKVIQGKKNPPKVVEAIKDILNIKEG